MFVRWFRAMLPKIYVIIQVCILEEHEICDNMVLTYF